MNVLKIKLWLKSYEAFKKYQKILNEKEIEYSSEMKNFEDFKIEVKVDSVRSTSLTQTIELVFIALDKMEDLFKERAYTFINIDKSDILGFSIN